MIDRTQDLPYVCLAYVNNSNLRIVTKHEELQRALFNRMTYKHVFRGARPSDYRTELIPVYDAEQLNGVLHILTGVGFLTAVADVCRLLEVPLEIYNAKDDQRILDCWRCDPAPLQIRQSEWNSLRERQQAAVKYMRVMRRGRFRLSTGSGKSHLIAWFCKFAHKSRILVTAVHEINLGDLFEKIVGLGVEVQRYKGSNSSKPWARVVCCSTRSLKHLHEVEFDYLLADEIQEHGSASAVENVLKVRTQRAFGFSANIDDRQDNADMWTEAVYGDVLLNVTYQQNVDAGDVVPIYVRKLDTSHCTVDVPARASQATRERLNFWHNRARNLLFAQVAQHYMDQGKQVLILTRTTEHALQMKKLIDLPVVFRPPTDKKRANRFISKNLAEEELLYRSKEELQELAKKFANRELLGVIANQLWFVGADFRSLDVLCRVDGLAATIPCTQATGRLSRTFPGKEFGLLVDADDQFSESTAKRANKRFQLYKRNKWQVRYVG